MTHLILGTAIHGFDAVVATGNKLLKAAKACALRSGCFISHVNPDSGGPRDCHGAKPPRYPTVLRHICGVLMP
jgi:hypothetical protein